MPVLAAPPRAVEAAPAPWPAANEEEAVLVVPALQELLPLQPAKLAVYKLFTEQVHAWHTILDALCFWLQRMFTTSVQSGAANVHSTLLAGLFVSNSASGYVWG